MPKLDSIREVVKKIASIEELRGKICFFGGAMPYIYHGEESGSEGTTSTAASGERDGSG